MEYIALSVCITRTCSELQWLLAAVVVLVCSESLCFRSAHGLLYADLPGFVVGGHQPGSNPHFPCSHPGGHPQDHRSVLELLDLVLSVNAASAVNPVRPPCQASPVIMRFTEDKIQQQKTLLLSCRGCCKSSQLL